MDKKKQGAINRKVGREFELKVRKDLEKEGWTVDKFGNNIDLEKGEIVQAGSKYIPGRGLMPGLGFPDFVMWRKTGHEGEGFDYELQFIECKTNIKTLSKLEKQKLDWLVKRGHKCLTAHNEEGNIIYREFLEYKEQKKVC